MFYYTLACSLITQRLNTRIKTSAWVLCFYCLLIIFTFFFLTQKVISCSDRNFKDWILPDMFGFLSYYLQHTSSQWKINLHYHTWNGKWGTSWPPTIIIMTAAILKKNHAHRDKCMEAQALPASLHSLKIELCFAQINGRLMVNLPKLLHHSKKEQ